MIRRPRCQPLTAPILQLSRNIGRIRPGCAPPCAPKLHKCSIDRASLRLSGPMGRACRRLAGRARPRAKRIDPRGRGNAPPAGFVNQPHTSLPNKNPWQNCIDGNNATDCTEIGCGGSFLNPTDDTDEVPIKPQQIIFGVSVDPRRQLWWNHRGPSFDGSVKLSSSSRCFWISCSITAS